MKSYYKVFVNAFVMVLLYVVITFLFPMVLLLSGNDSFVFNPQIFGAYIVNISIEGNHFEANATLLGVVIFALLGALIQLSLNKRKTS